MSKATEVAQDDAAALRVRRLAATLARVSKEEEKLRIGKWRLKKKFKSSSHIAIIRASFPCVSPIHCALVCAFFALWLCNILFLFSWLFHIDNNDAIVCHCCTSLPTNDPLGFAFLPNFLCFCFRLLSLILTVSLLHTHAIYWLCILVGENKKVVNCSFFRGTPTYRCHDTIYIDPHVLHYLSDVLKCNTHAAFWFRKY